MDRSDLLSVSNSLWSSYKLGEQLHIVRTELHRRGRQLKTNWKETRAKDGGGKDCVPGSGSEQTCLAQQERAWPT
ncbi:hypothetical protein INR49_008420 [Caranx melampygus]|nr:hypothetical protein INR49_008420 [Caranx melampygus]